MMSKLRRTLFLLAAALLALPAVAGRTTVTDPLTSMKTLQVEGTVVIDTEGKVDDYRIETHLGEPLSGAVDRAVRGWRFVPVVIDGQPRRAEARMRITLAATKVGEDFEVKVDNVIFPREKPTAKEAPAPGHVPTRIEAGKFTPPVYPPGLMFAGLDGQVLVALRVGEDGNAADVAAVQSMLLDVRGREKTLQQAVGLFEQASLAAARQWTFKLPPDFASWPPEKRVVTVSIVYTTDRKPEFDAPGFWRTIVRTPRREIDWMPRKRGTQAVGVADVKPGEFVPVASALTLASDVVGATL